MALPSTFRLFLSTFWLFASDFSQDIRSFVSMLQYGAGKAPEKFAFTLCMNDRLGLTRTNYLSYVIPSMGTHEQEYRTIVLVNLYL